MPAPAVAGDTFWTSVSGLSAQAPSPGTTYFLKHASNPATDITLQFREYASLVERTLRSKGLVRVLDSDQAQLVVLLDYGIGDEKRTSRVYSVPTFGQTGNTATYNPGVSYRGQVQIPPSVTNTPTMGVTGSSTGSVVDSSYDRWLKLTAISSPEFKTNGTIRELWQVDVKSTGSSNDLRRILPIMVYAAREYIGVNTGKAVDIKVKDGKKDFQSFLNSR